MKAPLLYSNNADIKYPLSDFHTEAIPNDILLDLSLSIPEGLVPVLGVLRVGPGFVFVSIENQSDRTGIAHLLVSDPIAARVYTFEMDVDGYGYAVFGPGASSNQRLVCTEPVELDKECWTALKQQAPALAVQINGFPRKLDNTLSLISATDMLLVSVEGNTIYLDRNDLVLSEDDRVGLSMRTTAEIPTQRQVLYSVAGVGPDVNGNIDIVIRGCVADCGGTRSLTIPRGDTGQGETTELPLDIFTQKQYDPCAPSSNGQQEGGGSDTQDIYSGCTEIESHTIIDVGTGKAVGTLYTAKA